MGIKELQRWMDSVELAPAPWACDSADWATGLNLLARLLHSTLAQRIEDQVKLKAKTTQKMDGNVNDTNGEKRNATEEEGGEEVEGKAEEDSAVAAARKDSQQTHLSVQLTFQETMEMAEHVLGVPQLALVADIKRGVADNQLALFVTLRALQFAMGTTEMKPYRELQFAFRIYFDMDEDGSSRQCMACGRLVHLIERLVLNGRCWHRACLKCVTCGRQLYRGTFHFVITTTTASTASANDAAAIPRPECVEHFANSVLFGNPKQRLALPASSLLSGSGNSSEKRASIAAMSLQQQQQCSPPPRPPPPRMTTSSTPVIPPSTPAAIPSTTPKMPKSSECRAVKLREAAKNAQEENGAEDSIEKKIACAAAARHDMPVPKPRQSLLLQQQQLKKPENRAEKTSWEVLEYPEELNPFGDDEEQQEEEEEDDQRHKQQQRRQTQQQQNESTAGNPFDSDTASEEEDDDDDEEEEDEEGGMVQVDNPLDRVLVATSPRPLTGDEADRGSSTTPECSTCSSPIAIAHHHHHNDQRPVMVQLVKPTSTAAQKSTTDDDGPPSQSVYIEASKNNSEQQHLQRQQSQQYVPPLGPMPFRVVQADTQQQSAVLSSIDLRDPATSSGGTDHQQQQQQLELHELDTKLRRLHSQLDQWEITGARLEGQMLRELAQKENQHQQQQQQQHPIWRKSNKLTNEYAQLMHERCAALAKEAVLVRRYMDIFLGLAHTELERQMKAEQEKRPQRHNEAKSSRQFNDLLAQLLHIKNELMQLERREREARSTLMLAVAAETTATGKSVEKAAKENAKKERKRLKKTKLEVKEAKGKKEQAKKEEEAEEVRKKQQQLDQQQQQQDDVSDTKSSGGKSAGSGSKLLKNTLRSLKKKL